MILGYNNKVRYKLKRTFTIVKKIMYRPLGGAMTLSIAIKNATISIRAEDFYAECQLMLSVIYAERRM
jgi:hypothetical protein